MSTPSAIGADVKPKTKSPSRQERRKLLRAARIRAGLFYTLTSVIAYGLMPSLVRIALDSGGLSPTQISFWRFALAAPALWLFTWLSQARQPSRRQLVIIWRVLIVGAFYGMASVIAFTALQFIPAAVFILLFYTFPIMVALLSRALGEKLPRVFWLALLLTLCGVLLTAWAELRDMASSTDSGTLNGVLLALASAFLVALYFIVNQRILRGRGVRQGVAWILTSAAAALLLVLLLSGEGLGLEALQRVAPTMALLSFLGTSFGAYALNLGIQRLGAARASVVATSEPIFTLFFAWVLLGELLQPAQFLGGGLIFASVLLMTWWQLRPSKVPAAQLEGSVLD